MESIYEKYAKLLVDYSLALKKGQKVLVTSSYLAEEFLKEIYQQILSIGAYPDLFISINGTKKIFYKSANNSQLKYVSPINQFVVYNFDAILEVSAPFDLRELQDISPEKRKIVNVASTELKMAFRNRVANGGLKWTLCVFPTESLARECNMNITDYENFVYSACFLYEENPIAAWKQLKNKQQSVVDYLNNKSKIHLVGRDIDVSFSTNGRNWTNSAGTKNMPSGEIFIAPVEKSVNGEAIFSYPGFYMGQEIESIALKIRNGEIINWDAKKGIGLLNKMLEIPGAKRFGEVGIGMNEKIAKFTKNMLFDEKIAGTIHMAIGAAPSEEGRRNESPIHWDMLANMKEDGQIFADGELVYKGGRFII